MQKAQVVIDSAREFVRVAKIYRDDPTPKNYKAQAKSLAALNIAEKAYKEES